MCLLRGRQGAQALYFALICAAGSLLTASEAFYPAFGPLSSRRFGVRSASFPRSRDDNSLAARQGRKRPRHARTRLFDSIRGNRAKITRAMNSLRDALRAGDEELAERLKAFIMELRKRDPQFATQDAMDDALEKGLFATAAKLKLKLADINQNPFRQGLQDAPGDGGELGSGNSSSGDISEDMSWGFDQTFFGKEGGEEGEAEESEDYDEI